MKQIKKVIAHSLVGRSLSVFISDKHGVHRSKGKKTKTFPKINDPDKGKIKNS